MHLLILIISGMLLLSTVARAETLLQCKFNSGDRVFSGVKTTYTEGEIQDIFLKIDFEKEKVIESPFGIYGTFGISKTNILFTTTEVKWWGENQYVSMFANLNRQNGELKSVYNKKDGGESRLEYYICSKGKLKF